MIGMASDGGVLDTDLRQACLRALDKTRDRAAVRRHAEQFNWPAATRQFLDGLAPRSREAGRVLLAG